LESKGLDNLRFDRSSRLLNAKDFSYVFDKTELRGTTSGLLILARGNNLQRSRLGFVISKKNVRFAVQRNRIKRVIRESFRCHRAVLPSVDYVILARPQAALMTHTEIRAAIDDVWLRLRKPRDKRSKRA